MEIIGTALTSVVGAATGSTATAAPLSLTGGALGAAFSPLLGSSGALSVLQGGASAFSILSTLSAANAQSDNLRQQGEIALLNAGETRVQSIEDQADIKRELLATIGRRRVAYAASGIDVGFGAAVDAEAADTARADELVSRSEGRAVSALQNGLAVKARADSLAKRLRSNAVLSSLGTGLSTGFEILKRGPSFARA